MMMKVLSTSSNHLPELLNSVSTWLALVSQNAHLLLIFGLLLLSLNWCLRFRKNWLLISRIPSPPGHLVFGNIDFIIQNTLKYKDWAERSLNTLQEISFKYSEDGLWSGRMGFVKGAVVTGPEAAEAVLGSPHHTEKAFLYRFFKYFLGNGLATSSGNRWKYNRKLLNLAFHHNILKNFLPIFNRQQKALIKVIDEKCKVGGVVDDIRPIISLYVLDTLFETTMGLSEERIKNESLEYLVIVKKLFETALYALIRPWYWCIPITKRTAIGKEMIKYITYLHELTYKVIRNRKDEILRKVDASSPLSAFDQLQNDVNNNSSSKHQLAFLDLLLSHHLKNPKQLTNYHVRSEVDTFMFAGHHTTATALCWTLQLVGRHPEVQAKIQCEVDRVFANVDQTNEMNSLRELKYLECVIKESLRLFPAAPIIGRQAGHDIQCGRFTIPKGTNIAIFIYHIHQLPDYYPQPHDFIPERFQTDHPLYQNAKHHSFAYLPFSAGPRNCIGQKYSIMQQKLVLASIFKKYNITALVPTTDILLGIDFVFYPKSPVTIKFEKRDN